MLAEVCIEVIYVTTYLVWLGDNQLWNGQVLRGIHNCYVLCLVSLGLIFSDIVFQVHFINAEALIHLLRTEGVELNDEPLAPQDSSKRPKGYIPKKPEEMPDWIAYREWIKDINQESVNSFLRATAIGNLNLND